MNLLKFRGNSKSDSNGTFLQLNYVQKGTCIFRITCLDDVFQTLLFLDPIISGKTGTDFRGTFHSHY